MAKSVKESGIKKQALILVGDVLGPETGRSPGYIMGNSIMASGNAKKNNIAIFAVTSKGADLGRRLKIMLPGSRLFLAEKRDAVGADEQAFSTSLKTPFTRPFMSTGRWHSSWRRG